VGNVELCSIMWQEQLVCVQQTSVTGSPVCPSVAVDATLDGCSTNYFVLSGALVVLRACTFLTSVFNPLAPEFSFKF